MLIWLSRAFLEQIWLRAEKRVELMKYCFFFKNLGSNSVNLTRPDRFHIFLQVFLHSDRELNRNNWFLKKLMGTRRSEAEKKSNFTKYFSFFKDFSSESVNVTILD